MGYILRLRVAAVGVAIIGVAGLVNVANGAPEAPPSTAGTGVSPLVPVSNTLMNATGSFDALRAANLGTFLGSCFSGNVMATAQGLGGLAGGQGFGVAGPDTMCPAAFDPKIPELDQACRAAPLIVGRQVNQAFISQMKSDLDRAIPAYSCKVAKAEAIVRELGCMKDQVGPMEQYVQNLNQAAGQYLSQAEAAQNEYKAIVADYQALEQDFTNRLSGADGAPGLRQTLDDINKIVDASDQSILQVERDFTSVKNEAAVIEQQKQEVAMAKAMDCFNNQGHAGYTCISYEPGPNGAMVRVGEEKLRSYADFLQCQYRNSFYVGEGGKVERDSKKVQKTADTYASQLSTILAQMTSSTPSSGKFENVEQAQAQSAGLLSADDLMQKYGSQLDALFSKSKYGGVLKDTLSKGLAFCQAEGKKAIQMELKREGSKLQMAELAQKDRVKAAQGAAAGLAKQWEQPYLQMKQALQLNGSGLVMAGCDSQDASTQTACLRSMKDQLRAYARGTNNATQCSLSATANAACPFTVKAESKRGHLAAVNCSSLNDCITQTQVAANKMKKEAVKYEAARTAHAQKVKAEYIAQIRKQAKTLQAMNTSLKLQLGRIMKGATEFGVSPSALQTTTRQGEPIEIDQETGLPKPPSNILDVISGQMNPGLISLESGGVDEIVSKVNSSVGPDRQKRDELIGIRKAIDAWVESCKMRLLEEREERVKVRVEAAARQLDGQLQQILECGQNAGTCGNGGSLETLAESVQGTLSAYPELGGIDPEVIQSLSSGASGLCANSGEVGQKTKGACERVTRNALKAAGALRKSVIDPGGAASAKD